MVGPCSVHDVKAALEYAKLLKAYADEASDDLHILMRVYFEKVPRRSTFTFVAHAHSSRRSPRAAANNGRMEGTH